MFMMSYVRKYPGSSELYTPTLAPVFNDWKTQFYKLYMIWIQGLFKPLNIISEVRFKVLLRARLSLSHMYQHSAYLSIVPVEVGTGWSWLLCCKRNNIRVHRLALKTKYFRHAHTSKPTKYNTQASSTLRLRVLEVASYTSIKVFATQFGQYHTMYN